MPSIPRVLHQGLAVDKPTPDATLNQGWLYYETDTGQLMQSWNGAWVMLTAASAVHKLDEAVVGAGGQAFIEFLSIPGTYRSLEVIGSGRGTRSASVVAIGVQFNGDTGLNYDYEQMYTSGTSAALGYEQLGTDSLQAMQFPAASSPSGYVSSAHVIIPNYTSTLFHKSMLAHQPTQRDAASGDIIDQTLVGVWHSTSPITSMRFTPAFNNFAEGTVISLYGRL